MARVLAVVSVVGHDQKGVAPQSATHPVDPDADTLDAAKAKGLALAAGVRSSAVRQSLDEELVAVEGTAILKRDMSRFFARERAGRA